ITDRDFWTRRTHPDDRSIRENGRAALARDGKVEIVTRMLSDDGQYRWIFERHRYEFSRDGKPVRQEGIASDITALKQTQQQLEEERVLLRSVIDHLPDYVYVKDRNLKHIIHNKANVELVGDVDLTGKDVVEIFGEAGRGYYEDDVRVLQSGKALLNREETILNKAGEQRILLTTKVPLIDKEGNTHGLVGISRDITDVRRQEAELNRYRENLDIIFSNSHENFLLLDHTGKVILFNKTLVKTISHIIGREPTLDDYVWDITTPERKEVSKQLVARVARGESIHTEAWVPGEEGDVLLEVRYQGVFVEGVLKYIIIISTDVTQIRNQQLELNKYRDNLDVIFSNTIEQILLLDGDGRVIQFNRAYEQFIFRATGRVPQVGQYLWEVTLSERASTAKELFARALKGEPFVTRAFFMFEGEPRIHELRYGPVVTEQNRVRFVTVIASDVTEIWQQQEKLRESEAYLRTIFESTGELFVLTDRDLIVRAMNTSFQKFHQLYGRTVRVGESILDLQHPESVEPFHALKRHVENGEPFTYVKNFGTDDKPHWLNVTFRKVGVDQGEFEGYCLSAVDITEIQMARTELAVSEERFHELVRSSDDVFAIVNEQFQCSYVSPNVKRILGYDVTDWLNKSIAPLIHADDFKEIRERLATIPKLEEGTRFGSLRRILHRDGSWRWMEGTAISLYNTPGIRGLVIVIHDVTERKLREQDILSLKDSLSDFQNAIFRSSIVSRADR
ncbi:MAG: PAS domain S-box protein, partial [Bacteroidota bacterium]